MATTSPPPTPSQTYRNWSNITPVSIQHNIHFYLLVLHYLHTYMLWKHFLSICIYSISNALIWTALRYNMFVLNLKLKGKLDSCHTVCISCGRGVVVFPLLWLHHKTQEPNLEHGHQPASMYQKDMHTSARNTAFIFISMETGTVPYKQLNLSYQQW